MRIDASPALPDIPSSAVAGHSTSDIIHIFESMLFEDAGAEAGTIPRAANKDGCFILVQLIVAGAKLSHRDIDGAFDLVFLIFQRRPHLQQHKIGGARGSALKIFGGTDADT